MARLIKALWFISLFAGLGVLLYTYAGLPENVVYQLTPSSSATAYVEKETFFYLSLAVLVIVNFSLYTVSRSLTYKNESTRNMMAGWQLGLAMVLNLFFIVIWNFFFLVNSGESVDYDHYGYMLYVTIGLVGIWLLALPVLLVRKRKPF